MKDPKEIFLCPKCDMVKWRTSSKKDRVYQCRGCGWRTDNDKKVQVKMPTRFSFWRKLKMRIKRSLI